ncbi:MAG TPA: sn-glycerol-3-phosphate ABC transporter ATP-binding protein UgpC [Geminicoccaceae bacterium]|nr:sn-glycerol-3-phosphate ABC transporter ATP-binding protein UgpC [Geminicoccaceae bacterium]
MARLTIRGLHKRYGKVHALRGIDLDIAEGEFCVFVGPSGCGKSTLLRTIAGLEDTDSGSIAIGGEPVDGVRPRDRDIAMVFQNYALYPYLNVFENIAFGLRARRFAEAEIRARVGRAAVMLGIGHLLDRFPRELSGGQRQRVAIGRAIVRDARLFLFDEPLSNLDAQLRDGMRAEIKRLHQEIGKTTVYVTHDQVEAMTLADRIVLLRDGLIEQEGAPLDLFERPATRFVAGFLGSPAMNFVPCRLEARDDGGDLAVRFDDGRELPLPPDRVARYDPWRDHGMVLGIRPEHLSRADGAPPRPGQAPQTVTVDLIQPTGTRAYAAFRLGGVEVTAELPAHAVERPGTELPLLVDTSRAVLIDPRSERVV